MLMMQEQQLPGQGMIACQGIPGAYSQITAKELFPEGTFLYFKNFRAVARAVCEEMCDYGVLPIENNTYGSVREVYKVIGEENISIVRGYTLRINHMLLAKPGTKLSDVKKILSHEQALGQCSEFLHSLGDKVQIIPALNTAVAARTVADSEDPSLAAISSPVCSEIYGLDIIKRKIADTADNYTRFICVAKEPVLFPGAGRISMVFSLLHRPGSLATVLDVFSNAGIDLLKIESVPIPGRNFEFRFYIDIAASLADEKTIQVLKEMEELSQDLRILGCYTEEAAIG